MRATGTSGSTASSNFAAPSQSVARSNSADPNPRAEACAGSVLHPVQPPGPDARLVVHGGVGIHESVARETQQHRDRVPDGRPSEIPDPSPRPPRPRARRPTGACGARNRDRWPARRTRRTRSSRPRRSVPGSGRDSGRPGPPTSAVPRWTRWHPRARSRSRRTRAATRSDVPWAPRPRRTRSTTPRARWVRRTWRCAAERSPD